MTRAAAPHWPCSGVLRAAGHHSCQLCAQPHLAPLAGAGESFLVFGWRWWWWSWGALVGHSRCTGSGAPGRAPVHESWTGGCSVRKWRARVRGGRRPNSRRPPGGLWCHKRAQDPQPGGSAQRDTCIHKNTHTSAPYPVQGFWRNSSAARSVADRLASAVDAASHAHDTFLSARDPMLTLRVAGGVWVLAVLGSYLRYRRILDSPDSPLWILLPSCHAGTLAALGSGCTLWGCGSTRPLVFWGASSMLGYV